MIKRMKWTDLQKLGRALDAEAPRSLGETLLCYADDWRLDAEDARRYRAIRDGRIYVETARDSGSIYVAAGLLSEYCKTGGELDAFIDRELLE